MPGIKQHKSGKTATPVQVITHAAHELRGAPDDLDPVMDLIGDTPFVLLGEATHGTAEFYRARAEITKRLITERGCAAVAVEADWPDAYRINRYVRFQGDDESAIEALSDFRRFPRWMWRNTEIVEFIEWLREYNRDRMPEARTGFYGLDLYSLHRSIDEVIRYLDRVDPGAAQRARVRYSCLDHSLEDEHQYGLGVSVGLHRSCENEVIEQLIELRENATGYLHRDGMLVEDEQFQAEQNARLIRNAEEYYRAMFGRRVNTWNLRDRHMTDTLGALAQHLSRRGRTARIAVWEHNSHIGDASATEMHERGEFNVGELARRRYGSAAVLIGFTTYTGTVAAASDWGGEVERKRIVPALTGSVESMMHSTGLERFFVSLREPDVNAAISEPLLERAIGVIYRPRTERLSHYFHATVPRQFDGLIHIDTTSAVRPLDRTAEWEEADAPETYPFGL